MTPYTHLPSSLTIPLSDEPIGELDEDARLPARIQLIGQGLGGYFPLPGIFEATSRLLEHPLPRVRKGGAHMAWHIPGGAEVSLRQRRSLARTRCILEELQCSQHPWICCPHTLAVACALVWTERHEHPEIFEVPAWELELGPLIEESAPPVVGSSGGGPGWLTYQLQLMPDLNPYGQLPRDSFTLEIGLQKLSKRTGQPLKAARAPTSWEGVQKALSHLTSEDQARYEAARSLIVTLMLLRQSNTVTQNKQLAGLAETLALQALQQLASGGHLYWEEAPLQVELGAPLALEIDLQREGDAWRPRLTPEILGFATFPLSVVITADRTLRLLRPEHTSLLRRALRAPLPKIPRAELPRFIQRTAASRLPAKLPPLPPEQQPLVQTPQGRAACLYLSELDHHLVVTARFVYTLDGQDHSLEPGEAGSWLDLTLSGGEPRLLQRDLAWEQERAAELAPALGPGATSAILQGNDAIDLLAERLPALPETWTIYGDRELVRFRYAGMLTPSITFSSGTDWFDLVVAFTAGTEGVSTRQLIKSWREGQRYIALRDGSLARLPDQWLRQHGESTSELLDLQRAGQGRLSAFAAPAALDLIDQLPGERLDAQALQPWRELAAKLRDFGGIPHTPLPEGVHAQLRSYQQRGFDWLVFLRDHNLSGCLADDMGLGKTLQALALLVDTFTRQDVHTPALIVAPTSVLWNWQAEAARFTPGLRVQVHHGLRRSNTLKELRSADLIVTSYALLRQDRELLREIQWSYLILDEAQYIKNPTAQVAQVARGLQADRRLAMTGTPVENNLVELWSIFQFLMPGFFGSLEGFRRRYVNPLQRSEEDMTVLTSLRQRLRPFVLRRLKREVAQDLPPRQEVVLHCELSRAERKVYDRVRDTYRDAVLSDVDVRGVKGATIHILEALTRLRQACCHPGLLPFPEVQAVTQSAKIKLLMETLETLLAEHHRALIFSQWPSLLAFVRQELEQRSWPYLYLDGGTSNRGALVDSWNQPDGPPLFLISLKAGGTGLNLTAADTVFHLDPWWNPAVEDQATDRAHRIGQRNPVTVYRLVARDTVEEKIVQLQQRKRDLIDAAINDDRVAIETLSREDLEAVFAAGEG